MTDPISFASATPRFALPMLFAAQAQKETFVNEAHVLTDALLHPVVEGESNAEPVSPLNGECWLVGAAPSGTFATHEDAIACHHEGQWLFAAPIEGMAVFDRSSGQFRHYHDGWASVSAISPPSGGAVADQEAREAINSILDALAVAGILPNM